MMKGVIGAGAGQSEAERVRAHATFGKYVLLRKLATGGMGEVFLAKQVGPSGFEKLLVIKRILAHHHDKHEYLDMFLSEAKLVARLTHSNIIQIHEMGQIDGDYFIAMEYLRGKSLRDIIDVLRSRGQQLPLPHVVDLAMKLCDGLGYAHSAKDIRGRAMNIIHRDVNPHNVLISYQGDLKLIDFGIAKSEMASVHTATGTIKGKFVYMSPEQSAADPIDRRSDIFSLGIVLYEMTTLENPFVRQNVVLSLEAIQRHPVPSLAEKRPDAEALSAILDRALEKDPENRYQTCEEMRDDLRDLLRTGAVKPEEHDLSTYFSELFADDIDEEDRLLAEADAATTPPPHHLTLAPSAEAGGTTIDEDDDEDVTRRGRPLSRPSSQQPRAPRPITTKPFADDEPTVAGDLDDLAYRSRMKSAAGLPQPEPTGQVLTLIPPEDVVAGTSEQFGADMVSPEPHTRKDRIPIGAPSSLRLAPQPMPTADMPANEVPPPTPHPTEDLPPAIGMLQEPLPDRGRLETKEIRAGGALADMVADVPDTPVGVPSHNARHSEPPRDPSVSLPVYAGPWRRSMVIAATVVFVLTAVAGYWFTRMLTSTGSVPAGIATSVQPAVKTPKPEPKVAATDVVPAPDPVAKKPGETAAPAEPEAAATVVDPPRKKRRGKTRRSKRRAKQPEAATPVAPATDGDDDDDDATAAAADAERAREAEEAKRKAADREAEAERRARERAEAAREDAARADREAAEKAERARAAEKAKAPTPKKAAVGDRLGILTIRSSAAVKVEHAGRSAGSAPSSLIVRGESGRISLTGDDFEYTITLNYEATEDGLVVSVQSEPWAIAKHNGISLGKTPQGPVKAGKRHRFSLIRPGQRTPVVVSLVWNPTR